MRTNRVLGVGLNIVLLVLGVTFSWLLKGTPYFRIGLILLITGIIGLIAPAARKTPQGFGAMTVPLLPEDEKPCSNCPGRDLNSRR